MFSTNSKQLHLFREGINSLRWRVRGLLVQEVLQLSSYTYPVSRGWISNGSSTELEDEYSVLTNEESLVKTLYVPDYGSSFWPYVITNSNFFGASRQNLNFKKKLLCSPKFLKITSFVFNF